MYNILIWFQSLTCFFDSQLCLHALSHLFSLSVIKSSVYFSPLSQFISQFVLFCWFSLLCLFCLFFLFCFLMLSQFFLFGSVVYTHILYFLFLFPQFLFVWTALFTKACFLFHLSAEFCFALGLVFWLLDRNCTLELKMVSEMTKKSSPSA